MRIVSRTTRSMLDQRQAERQRRRAAAGPLHSAFPNVEQVRVVLRFVTPKGPAPAAQTHALYPAAPASFEFSCPFGDCDGSFDLDDVIRPLLAKSGGSASGTQSCAGSRAGGNMTRQPCRLRLAFRVLATYRLRA